jgi:O-antigen ligase
MSAASVVSDSRAHPDEALRQTRASRVGLMLVGSATVLVYTQLVLFGSDSGLLAAFFGFADMVFAAVVLVWVGERIAGRFAIALAMVLAPILLAAAWAVLGARLGRPYAPDAIGLELVKLGGLAGLVAAGALIGRDRRRFEMLGSWFALAGLAFAVFSLILARIDPLTVWGVSKGAHTYRFTGTLTNANAAGCVFGMITLVSIGCGLGLVRKLESGDAPQSYYPRVALIACAVLSALSAMILTGSRTSLIVSLSLGVALVLATLRRHGRLTVRRTIAVFGVLIAGVVLAMSQVAGRWHTLSLDSQQRGLAYAHYMQLTGKAPWFGVGLGGFRPVNQAALTPADAPYLWDYGSAHSALLQAAMEGGWPYAALLALATLALILPMLAAAREGRLGALGGGILAAGCLAGACATEDIALNVPAIAAFCALILGAGMGAATPRRRREAPAPADVIEGVVHA